MAFEIYGPKFTVPQAYCNLLCQQGVPSRRPSKSVIAADNCVSWAHRRIYVMLENSTTTQTKSVSMVRNPVFNCFYNGGA